MDWRRLVDRLETGGRVLCGLFADVDEDEARWKPSPQRWSMLEVVNHLWDEEKDDFRKRAALTLEDPAQEWPPIDTEGWVRERRYNERGLAESVAGFKRERAASLVWLRSLEEPPWEQAQDHPRLGRLSAGDFLTSWVAHDYLHVRQIAKLRVEYLALAAAPYSTRYAAP